MSWPPFDRLMSLLQRRTSRRRLLERLAVAGSAMAVAPMRYLLEPVSALGVITCANCSSGSACCDGWTTFCCSITGGENRCPSYSYMAGWWKCTDYNGGGLCAGAGVRYYIDCNRTPGTSCPEGCHCAHNSCGYRRTCCNVFRYGQCNTHISGVTEVVCRVVTCVSPAELYVNCNATYFQENAVCAHEAPCL